MTFTFVLRFPLTYMNRFFLSMSYEFDRYGIEISISIHASFSRQVPAMSLSMPISFVAHFAVLCSLLEDARENFDLNGAR